jgi:hypothetical protein
MYLHPEKPQAEETDLPGLQGQQANLRYWRMNNRARQEKRGRPGICRLIPTCDARTQPSLTTGKLKVNRYGKGFTFDYQ